MKYFKLSMILFAFFACNMLMGQTITINACNPLFDNQDFVFTNVGTDITGRNIYETTLIDGNQPCSGLGICEFRIAWNDGNSKWELIGDDGNGGFGNTYLIYSNTAASVPNPPSLALGAWVENTDDTAGSCGGDGGTSIGTLSGEVQDELTVLSLNDFEEEFGVVLYPNPSSDLVYIQSKHIVSNVDIYDIAGKLILKDDSGSKEVNVKTLQTGLYIIKLQMAESVILKRLVIK